MSRFYARGSDSESESSSDDEPQLPKAPIITTAYDDLSDEEEETGKRIVRSAKEKRYEEMTGLLRKIRNFRKNIDMSNLLDCFEDLVKAHQKALPVIMKEEKGVTPGFYLRNLAQLELFVNTQWENKKNMSKGNARALGTLRQKLRKYNKDFEKELTKYRENPELLEEDEEGEEEKEGLGQEEDEESESDSDDDDSEPRGKTKSKPPKKERAPKMEGDEDESDDSYWGSSDSESSSSSDDETQYASLREKFLKKPGGKDEMKEKKEKKADRKAAQRSKRREEEVQGEMDDGPEWEVVNRGALTERPKMFSKDEKIDVSVVTKKLAEIIGVRGKKGTDKKEQVELLVELETVATTHELGPAVGLKIAFAIVAAIFDYSMKIHEIQRVTHWLRLLDKVTEMLGVAVTHKDTLTIDEEIPEDEESLSQTPYKVRGCLMTVFERLDEEFFKVLKELDSHSFEYLERVGDERRLCDMLEKLISYFESTHLASEKSIMCRAYFKKIEHLYYKFDVRVLKKKRGEYGGETSVDEMQRLGRYIYSKDTTDRLRTRAILCHMYHHAVHDNWFQARDLLLMSHLQEVIQHSDPVTQIMYNRAMVQLGICAFRHESIVEAHHCLSDLMMSARVKELLAQGLMPQHRHDRSLEQEKIERSRQVPFHMQLNLDVIECVYLISAMLLEVPYIAEHEFDAKRRPISKTFYHQLRTMEKQSLTGPPESMREHVVAAARAMKKGNWAKCYAALVNEKMEKKVWHFFTIYDHVGPDGVQVGVRELIKRKVKEESLRTYLFTYSHVYDSISLTRLGEMFELPETQVHSIVAKMIINQELMASMDEPSKSIVLHRTEPSRLQSMLLQLSDKVNLMRETSDRSLETKIQGGPGTMGPSGKGKRFNRPDWKGNRRGNNPGQQRPPRQSNNVY